MSYLIKKDSKTNTITYMEYELEGYKFKPKSSPSIKVSQITVVNNDMIDKILTIKFSQMFKKLTVFIMQNLYSDDEESDANTNYALTEIERLKSIIRNKYNKINKEKKEFFLKQLAMLEQQLRMKMMQKMQYMNMNMFTPQVPEEQELEQGRGR